MPRRSEIVRTETNLDLPPHPRLLRSHALDVALGHLSLERVPVWTLGGHVAPPEVGPSERSAGCRDLLGDALPDETLLLPSRQMPRRSEIVRSETDLDLPPHPRLLSRSHAPDVLGHLSLERGPVRTLGGHVAPPEVGPPERSAGCRDWLVYALPDVTLASASELDLGLTTLEGTFLGFEWKILVLVSNWNFTNIIGNVSQAGIFK